MMVFNRKSCIFMSMNTGIYRIKNIKNHKFYIGSTSTMGFQNRWKCHLKNLRRSTHPNQHLQYAWNKYGESCFKFEVVESCLPAHCISREQYYFDKLNPQYNILPVAGSVRGYRHTLASKALIAAASSGENHPQYTGKHRFYHPSHGIYEGSLVEFGKTFGMTKSISYKLRLGILDKSHGWVYLSTIEDAIPDNLDEVYRSKLRNNRPLYNFIHQN
jgi:group I intron endonuclease